jgi:DNA-binding CsgD family transcriptional regulator
MSDKSIAAKHGISFWTVRTHIQRIFEKLDVNNRRELIAKFRSDD